MEENRTENPVLAEEMAEIRIMDLIRGLGKEWKVILKWALIAAAVGIVIAVSIPDEYSVSAKLMPEKVSRQNSNVSTMATIAGINLGTSTTEAVSPETYPEIIKSNPFVTDLFPVPVEYKTRQGRVSSDYYTYARDYLRYPWWKEAAKLPKKLVRWVKSLFKGKSQPVVGYENLNLSHLTSEQSKVAGRIRSSLSLSVDKNSVITLTAKAQDPQVAATVAAEVVERLKAFVIEYRTEKARLNLQYYQKLYDESREKYFSAQQRYANYVDSHQGVVLQRVRTEQERLQNEMNLQYQLYNSCAQQLQAAQAKLQEETPVFTMINPPAVPLSPTGPSRGLIIFALALLGAILACFWILLGRDWARQLKQGGKPAPEDPESDS